MWSAGQGDNQERFLADLRALRDAVALGYEELAARAHYPSNILKEAENGPGLPGLPILAAFLRACDADVPEWEERWRRLACEAQADLGLPVRPAGASPAAVAGARAGITVAPPDAYDPERIRAALRGKGGSVDHAVRDVGQPRAAAAGRVAPDPAHANPGIPDGPQASNSRPGWGGSGRDADSGRDVDSRRDADSGRETGRGWEMTPGWETEARWDSAPGRQTGPSWDTAPGWQTGPSWDTAPGRQTGPDWDTALSWAAAAGEDTAPTNGNHHATYANTVFDTALVEEFGSEAPAPATREDPVSDSWRLGSDVASPPETDGPWLERTDAETTRWSPDSQLAPSVTADSESAWRPTDTGFAAPEDAEPGPGLAQGTGSAGAQGTGSAGAQGTGSAGAQGTGSGGAALPQAATVPTRAPTAAAAPDEPNRDRFFPLRLIAVMVAAAIIGSLLVLLIK